MARSQPTRGGDERTGRTGSRGRTRNWENRDWGRTRRVKESTPGEVLGGGIEAPPRIKKNGGVE